MLIGDIIVLNSNVVRTLQMGHVVQTTHNGDFGMERILLGPCDPSKLREGDMILVKVCGRLSLGRVLRTLEDRVFIQGTVGDRVQIKFYSVFGLVLLAEPIGVV